MKSVLLYILITNPLLALLLCCSVAAHLFFWPAAIFRLMSSLCTSSVWAFPWTALMRPASASSTRVEVGTTFAALSSAVPASNTSWSSVAYTVCCICLLWLRRTLGSMLAVIGFCNKVVLTMIERSIHIHMYVCVCVWV